jgi:hypothetical protein
VLSNDIPALVTDPPYLLPEIIDQSQTRLQPTLEVILVGLVVHAVALISLTWIGRSHLRSDSEMAPSLGVAVRGVEAPWDFCLDRPGHLAWLVKPLIRDWHQFCIQNRGRRDGTLFEPVGRVRDERPEAAAGRLGTS